MASLTELKLEQWKVNDWALLMAPTLDKKWEFPTACMLESGLVL